MSQYLRLQLYLSESQPRLRIKFYWLLEVRYPNKTPVQIKGHWILLDAEQSRLANMQGTFSRQELYLTKSPCMPCLNLCFR